ncbi:MAG: hypothetical protein ACEPOW_07605 [Bacteroidales bacterium]
MKINLLIVCAVIALGAMSCKKDDFKPDNKIVTTQQKSESTYRLSHWMQDIFKDNSDVPLNEIVMPGSHDAATYKISQDSDWARDAAWYKRLGGKRPAYFWSFATRSSIYDLLEIGVRNFDIRLEHNDKGYFSYHGLLSTNMNEIIDDFARFIHAHPKEIIHIELRCDEMDQHEYEHVIGEFLLEVGKSKVVSQTCGLTPTSTIGEYWAMEKSLLISCYRHAVINGVYSLKNFMQSTWANKDHSKDVEEYIYNHIKTRPMNVLYSSSMTQTPDAGSIVGGAFEHPKSLEDLVCHPTKYGAINTEVDTWLPKLKESAESAGKKLNIVTVDFAETNNITKKIIDMNLQ